MRRTEAARELGGFVRELRDGRGIRVDTFTEDAKDLAETIHRAVHLGELPRGRGRRP
ncbi:hypothetical protein [Streptomyces californicus]|uniref:hypothetical protein n=1 Tax=Streptomyces californicus TaxID=67351 RepID=UPI0036B28186